MSAAPDTALAVVEDDREPFVPGIRTDLAHDAYLSVEALSSSALKLIHQRSLLHWRYLRDNPTDDGTISKDMGTALHMGVLEPERVAGEIAVLPEDAPKRPSVTQLRAKKPSPATIDAIAWWQDWNQRTADKLILTPTQERQVAGMIEAVRKHPRFEDLFTGGHPEVAFQWRDARLDLPCKAKFDYLTDDGFATDLKSCRDASPLGFARAVTTYLYHFQQAHYNTGHEHLRDASLRGFVFVAVEPDPPHAVGIYVLPSNAIQFATAMIENAMVKYADAQRRNWWPGYSERIQQVVLPRWATSIITPESV